MNLIPRLIFIFLLAYSIRGESIPDSTLKKIKSFNDPQKVEYLANLGWSLREQNTDLALTYAKEAVRISDSLNILKNASKANNFLGVIYIHYKYDTERALPYFHRGLEIAKQTDDSIEIAYSYNNLGDVFYLSGNVPLAVDYAQISFDIFKKLNDSRGIAYSYINLGLAYRLNKKYDLALDCFNKAIELREKIGFKIGVASAILEVAISFYEKGDYEKALKYFEKSLELHEKIDNKKYMAFSLNGIGDVYYHKGKYDQALQMYDEAIKLNLIRNHDYGIIDSRLGKALVYSKLQEKKSGEYELQEAFNIADTLGLQPKILKTYETAARFYINLNDYKSASKKLNNFLFTYDSLFSKQQFETLREIESRFLIDKKLKEARSELELKSRQQIYLVIIITLMAALIVLYLRRNKATKLLNDKLAESNKAKDKLFSIISHDLRNPFSALLGYLEFLKEKDITVKEREEYISDLEKTTKSTYELLENLLNLSASRAGNLIYNPTLFDIKILAENVTNSLLPIIKKKSINVIFKIDLHEFFADKQMIEIILRNLILNSVKYCNDFGTITISAWMEKDSYYLSVSDTGIGMKQETIKKIISSEIVESGQGTAGEKGTGLGLSLCKEFVSKHNGEIKIESKPDIGSTFTIMLPFPKMNLESRK